MLAFIWIFLLFFDILLYLANSSHVLRFFQVRMFLNLRTDKQSRVYSLIRFNLVHHHEAERLRPRQAIPLRSISYPLYLWLHAVQIRVHFVTHLARWFVVTPAVILVPRWLLFRWAMLCISYLSLLDRSWLYLDNFVLEWIFVSQWLMLVKFIFHVMNFIGALQSLDNFRMFWRGNFYLFWLLGDHLNHSRGSIIRVELRLFIVLISSNTILITLYLVSLILF